MSAIEFVVRSRLLDATSCPDVFSSPKKLNRWVESVPSASLPNIERIKSSEGLGIELNVSSDSARSPVNRSCEARSWSKAFSTLCTFTRAARCSNLIKPPITNDREAAYSTITNPIQVMAIMNRVFRRTVIPGASGSNFVEPRNSIGLGSPILCRCVSN